MPWFRAISTMIAAVTAFVLGTSADAGTLAPQLTAAAARTVPAEELQAGNVVPAVQSLLTAAVGQVEAHEAVAAAVGRLSARQLAGQRVIYSYSGPAPPASLLSVIRHGQAAGVIFFAGNYRSTSQFAAAVRELETANGSAGNPLRGYPLLLMTDQEGGEVNRLPGGPALSEKRIGAIGPLAAAEAAAGQAGTVAAASLASDGLNVDLAPVLDVYHAAGDFDDQFQRSYSSRPGLVSALAARFIAAMQAGKVAATAKHFPGLGAATAGQNTDNVAVTISLSAAQLASRDEYPYPAAIAAGVKLIMVSWASYPSLGASRPAGLSPVIVQDLLRAKLGFGGVTITDAIGAGALGSYGPVASRAVLAASAGMDLILASSQGSGEGAACTDGLESAYRDGKLAKASFQATVARILALRQSLPA